jgi:ABC-type sugar transport system permease subunit
VRQKILTTGPKHGPFFFFIVIVVMTLSGSATAATAAFYATSTYSGLNNFLVDLYTNHRLLYAVMVTVGTAVLGLILSLVMGWLLRTLRIDRLR